MEKQRKTNEISFALFWKVFCKRFLYLAIALVLGVSIGFVYSSFIATPVYSSRAEFLIFNNFDSANTLGSTYQQGAELYASSSAMRLNANVFRQKAADAYQEKYGIEVSEKWIKSKVSVSHISDSPVINVTVRSSNPEEALNILKIYEGLVIGELQDSEQVSQAKYISVLLITRGELANSPDSPNTMLNMFLGGASFAALAYAVFFLMALRDKTVYHEEDIKKDFGLSVLGAIPEWNRVGESAKSAQNSRRQLRRELRSGRPAERDIEGKLLDKKTPFSITESFKSLRTNLMYVGLNHGEAPVFGFVSDFAGAGKSLVVSNVAVAFAQLGKKVLLIDGDMRCPIQHRVFGVSRQKNGLSEALAGLAQNPLTECITKTEIEGLDLIVCGHIPPNPNELLASEQMKNLLENAKREYDYVLVDLPPVCATSDAGVLASVLTGYVMILRVGYSNKTAAQTSIDALHAVDANIIGAVINDINIRHSSRYYKAQGRYSHYYHLVVADDEQKAKAKK